MLSSFKCKIHYCSIKNKTYNVKELIFTKKSITISPKKFGTLEVHILSPLVQTECNLVVIGPATLFHTTLDISHL